MQIVDNIQFCSVLDELDELPAVPSGVLEEESEDDGNLAEQGGQTEQESASTQSQATCSANKKGRSLEGNVGGSEAAAGCDLLPHET